MKLLRTIQFGEVQRIGENAQRKLDVRIIAATNRDLDAMVKERAFRADLYYRLERHPHPRAARCARDGRTSPSWWTASSPGSTTKHGTSIDGISREAMDALMRYDFPGNVRELENLVERAVVLARGQTLLRRDFPEMVAEGEAGPGSAGAQHAGGLEEKVSGFETGVIEEALEKTRGNQSKAAEILGISERHMRSRMEKLGIRNRWK